MSAIIEVNNISKKYKIGHRQSKHLGNDSLLYQLIQMLRHPLTSLSSKKDDFWALKDVSFEVERGSVIGIVGRNGSGKSTLLKVLSQITEPTSGEAVLYGKVASLLEVGTGFHPELTGRENIYFNGSILGMSKKEIESKFDDIVDFSEVGQFLDTPVKFYSSGMYVRLAFAVAAHLEPDILIVDEVLAVGDASFQKKCLGKMGDVAKGGRTVIFVSHNMIAVEQLCDTIVHLDKGRVVAQGKDVKKIVKEYLFESSDTEHVIPEWTGSSSTDEYVTISRVAVVDNKGKTLTDPLNSSDSAWVQIEGVLNKMHPLFSMGYTISSEDGSTLYWCFHTDLKEDHWPQLKLGEFTLRSKLPNHLFNEGVYRINLAASLFAHGWLYSPETSDIRVFLSTTNNYDSPYWVSKRPTSLSLKIDWELVN